MPYGGYDAILTLMWFEKYSIMKPKAVIFRKVLTELSGNFLETIQKAIPKRIPVEPDTSDVKM